MALQLRLLAAGTVLGGWLGVAAAPAGAQEIKARTGSTVTVGGRVQVQYEASSARDSVSSFSVRRVWVTIDGRVSDRVGGRVQFNADGATVLDAYLELAHSPALKIQVGQFKRAMSHFWLAVNADLPMIERDARVTGVNHCPGVGGVCSFGQLTGALGLDTYEPGILATGRLGGGSLGYRVTLTNGEGMASDVNTAKSASGRLSFFPAEGTRLSAYLALDETLGSRGQTMRVPAYGAELEIGSWRNGPHLLVNGLTGRNWEVDDVATFTAFQLMALWYRPLESQSLAGVEPMLRFSWASTERPGLVPYYRGGGDGSDANFRDVTGTVITPGFMVYFAGRNGVAVNLDLYRSGEVREWSLKLQAFAFF
ncbi:MAG: hypothetical protein OXG58_08270 [Gemmatimonadetes bacterium]|nr:hypothetical protein [Gemmatimonadota bacterium]MCY3942772.1 hypothetical protein [Gemmatimonadota bacterium]